MLIQPARCTSKLNDRALTQSYIICEPKLDGSRYMLYIGFDPYERRKGNTLLSRRISSVDGKNVDRTGNIPHITGIQYKDLEGTILDGEVFLKDFKSTASVMGSGEKLAVQKQEQSGWLKYYVFDIPIFRGKDIRGLPLEQRRRVLKEVVKRMSNEYVKAVPQWKSELIEDKFSSIVAAGGEGLIIKDIRLAYGVGWAKMKKSYEVSCFIFGYKPGNGKYTDKVGAVELAVLKDGKPLPVGFASGFDDAIRDDMSNDPNKYLYVVCDVYAHEISDGNRLRHPTFYRFREDLEYTNCTFDKLKSDLKNKLKSNRWR